MYFNYLHFNYHTTLDISKCENCHMNVKNFLVQDVVIITMFHLHNQNSAEPKGSAKGIQVFCRIKSRNGN